MRKARALRPGDKVAVVAPASPFPRDEFDRGLAELRRLGFEPVFDDRLFARTQYLAGDPTLRATSFLDAWRDPDIAGIVAARGGYGSVQLLPLLVPEVFAATAKVFVGSSDLTALLSFLTTGCGIVSMHGPMVAGQLARGPEGYDLASWLAATARSEPMGEVGGSGLEIFSAGDVSGPLLGGNLTQLAASMGTPWAFDPPDGCVLFLEDVSERPYRIDRLLTQLRFAGVLGRARALVFGEMPGCDEPDGSLRCRDVVRACLDGFPGPVLFGLPAGHTAGPSLTLPLGVGARVVADGRARLVIEEPAVV